MRGNRFLLAIASLLFSFTGLAQAVDARSGLLDIEHYRFSITLNDENDTIKGEAIIAVKFLQPVTGFDFDLVKANAAGKGMTVTAIRENDNKTHFSQQEETLHIDASAMPGETHWYAIDYEGVPADGLIIAKNKYGHRTFFADNWPNRAHNWLPCIDHPADKASVEFIVTAPEHYQVVSNGILVEESNLPGHQKLTHWQETVALSTKIMVIGAADFAVSHAGDVGGIPVYSWVYPENKDKGFYDYALACQILPFFISHIGPYPYRKLANIQSKTMFGGMENAGAIFYSENSVKGDRKVEALLTHEIAHQWFGDYATEANWQHIWLSEGFATYMTHLYMEKTYGRDSLDHRLRDDRNDVIAFAAKSNAPVVDTSVNSNFMQLLNANSYQKGGWILHMLRRKLGDAAFWKGLRAYYTRYGGGNATTADFCREMEKAGGQHLELFFRQWLYTPGLPLLDAAWQYDAATKKLTIQLRQIQKTVFNFPLQVAVRAGSRQTVQAFTISSRQTTLSLPAVVKPAAVVLDPYVNLLFGGAIKEGALTNP
jgi:aminopeptidase N